VALIGLSCSVTCMMRDSISAVTVAGRPERGASLRSASMPPSKALAPQRHLASIQVRLHGNVLVLPPLGGQQDHECSLLEPGLHSSTFGEHTQFPLGVLVQFNRLGNSHRSSLLRDWRRPPTISSETSRALH
jgi:hypothetical protein